MYMEESSKGVKGAAAKLAGLLIQNIMVNFAKLRNNEVRGGGYGRSACT